MRAISSPTYAASAAIAVIAMAASMAAAPAAEMTPALKALAAAADKEGEVLVKWSGGTFGGPKGAKVIERHLNAAFGSKVTVKWTPGGAMPEIGNEIAIAYRNKLPSPADVYVGFSRNMAVFLKHDMFLKAPWKDYLPDRLTDRVVERDTYVKIQSATLGFTYNKALAPSAPERLEDLLKPEWKGKISTTAFAAGFEQLAAKEAWGPAQTVAFARKFATQVAGFMRCNEAERLSSGEFLAFAMDCSGANMMRAAAEGAPLVRVLTPDAPLISYFYLAVPKNARNPNAGRLFITYLMTKEGVKDTYDLTLNDLHLFPESGTLKEIQAVEKKYKIKFREADIAWQATENEAGNAAQREVAKIFRESGK